MGALVIQDGIILPDALAVGGPTDEVLVRDINGVIKYVSQASIASSSISSGSGITGTTTFDLGGDISQATTLKLTSTYSLNITNDADASRLLINQDAVVLTSVAGIIELNATLLQVTDSRAIALGLQYVANYSATFTDRSIIDLGTGNARYWKLDGANSLGTSSINTYQTLLRFINGATKIDLNPDSILLTTGTISFSVDESDDQMILASTGGDDSLLINDFVSISSRSTGATQLSGGYNATRIRTLLLDATQGYLSVRASASGVGYTLLFTETAVTLTDHTASPQGLKYASDYSATLVSLSLITKGYTDTHLGTKNLHTSITSAGAGQNGQVVYWDNVNNRFDLKTVTAGSSVLQKDVSTTTYTILAGDDGYIIYFTNVAGCNVTIPDTLPTNHSFTSVRATGAGTIDHIAGGTTIFHTIAGATDIQNEDTAATWVNKGSNNWYGFGALGSVGGGGGSGTVTSVALSNIASFATAGGTPITGAGTLSFTLNTQNANLVFAGPTTGTAATPTFRSLVVNDIPSLSSLYYSTTNPSGYITGNEVITLTGDVTGSGATSIATTIANNAVTGTKFRQSSGLSVVGRSANSTGNVADIIAANDFEVFRRSGTSIAFGAINLASSNAVTGVLPIANGGTGASGQAWWALTGTSTLTGAATITSNAANQHIFNGTFTATANNQYYQLFNPSITLRATTSDVFSSIFNTSTLTTGANSQTVNLINLSPTYALGTSTNVIVRTIVIDPTFTGNAPSGNTAIAIGSGRIGLRNLAPTATLDITGEGTTAATFSMRIRDNSNVTLFQYGDDGFFRFGSLGSPPILGSITQTSTTVSDNKAGGAVYLNTVNGTVIGMNFGNNGGYAPILRLFGSYTPTLVGATAGMSLSITPTLNQTGTAVASYTGILYNPTITALVGPHYGLIITPTSANSGLGVSAPTAKLHIAAHSTTAGTAPLKLTSGTAMTTPEDGALEYHSSHLYFTIGSTRYQLDQQGGGGISGLTTGRVTYATSATTIGDDSGFEYDSTIGRLTINSLRSSTGWPDLRLETSDTSVGAYILVQNDGQIILRNHANNDYISIINGNISGVGIPLTIRGALGESGPTSFGAGAGSSINNSGAETQILGANAYSVSGNGNGGKVLIQSGERRTAGSGLDGDIEIDPRTGFLDLTITPITGVATPSTHKVPIKLNGTNYWILVSNV